MKRWGCMLRVIWRRCKDPYRQYVTSNQTSRWCVQMNHLQKPQWQEVVDAKNLKVIKQINIMRKKSWRLLNPEDPASCSAGAWATRLLKQPECFCQVWLYVLQFSFHPHPCFWPLMTGAGLEESGLAVVLNLLSRLKSAVELGHFDFSILGALILGSFRTFSGPDLQKG